VFFPTDSFTKSPDLVLRRLPEWRQCYAYTPKHPEVYELNITAWLIVELCDGQPLAELERLFLEMVRRKTNPDEGKAQLHRGLQELIDCGILFRQNSPRSAETQGAHHD
jgi:hypothetical protein